MKISHFTYALLISGCWLSLQSIFILLMPMSNNFLNLFLAILVPCIWFIATSYFYDEMEALTWRALKGWEMSKNTLKRVVEEVIEKEKRKTTSRRIRR